MLRDAIVRQMARGAQEQAEALWLRAKVVNISTLPTLQSTVHFTVSD
jgi:hypothetical protein